MNGRIYDPVLARFMTADPFIQAPGNLQSYNRYAYVNNNPLGYTDPSGYIHKKLKNAVKKLTTNILEEAGANKYFGGLIQTGLLTSAFGQAYGWSTGDWKSVAQAYQTSAILAANAYFLGWAATQYSGTSLYAAHAAAGCVTAEASGGACGRGAASAVAGKWVNVELGGDFFAATIAGGAASVVGGGKFADGAIPAAFGYLFNQMSGCRCDPGSTADNPDGAASLPRDRAEAQAARSRDGILSEMPNTARL